MATSPEPQSTEPPAPEPTTRPDDHDDAPPLGSRYQRLDAAAVRLSTATLQDRIRSRFPDRGLWEVCGELLAMVDEVSTDSGISRRRVRLARVLSRLGVLALVAFMVGAIGLAAADIMSTPDALTPVDWLPLIETIINDLVFVGIAVFFLVAVPERLERARVLRLLHRLRSLAHVIDMHQLTKVPERLERGSRADGGLDLTRGELTHYLDYCTEMLSLVGKTAALFAEDTTDGDVLDAVEGMETLTSDMARKVWQKIAVIQTQGA
ncbi:hypothetical protein EDL96_03080 [Kocuria soli]|uniref:Uncharacterized protein n=1 Tax=Kocuria soli TaxID=2485125 RepID=A0A3N3ZZ48_9MICC|nr:hypothetical protein [Kocuria soli]ROZ64260.1 hypothetical protein EDL96_03080 [Kocuria soli]